MPLKVVLRPFQEFAKFQAAGGVLLFLCAIGALIWANSPWADAYHALWQARLKLGFGEYALTKPLLLWINDGLMAIFFFLVGLEIKRELLAGELSSPRQAALSIAAAAGGMLVPAVLYLAVNAGTSGSVGWGIPMATDIAFALGVLTVLGDRVPPSLKVFVTALAIVDDLAAVLVIALFYTAEIHWQYLGMAALPLIALVSAARMGLRRPSIYALLSLILWGLTLLSGIHATIAGVLLALTIPMRPDTTVVNRPWDGEGSMLTRMEHSVHPWVAYAILPVFALSNAGMQLSGDVSESITHPISLGIVLGLVAGKPLGVTIVCWLAVRSGLASLPPGVGWPLIGGAGFLAGIGFTMSLFISGLAFSEPGLLEVAKLGILAASLVAGVIGSLFLVVTGKRSSSA